MNRKETKAQNEDTKIYVMSSRRQRFFSVSILLFEVVRHEQDVWVAVDGILSCCFWLFMYPHFKKKYFNFLKNQKKRY